MAYSAIADIGWSPSYDGAWSTFSLLLGSQTVQVSVDISTAQEITYAVDPTGCFGNSTCISARGGIFDPSSSASWVDQGQLSLTSESQFGYDNIPGHYGFDNVTIGYLGGGGPSLGKQAIATFQSSAYPRGLFGILPKPFSFGNFTDPYPSYLQNLKMSGQVPSLSFGYTAGAKYRYSGVQGSLTLGGFDKTRFNPGGLSLPMNDNILAYMTVSLKQIMIKGSPSNPSAIHSLPLNVSLDSTLPYLWLPEDVCAAFESAFNLQYDSANNIYWIPQTVNDGLISTQANVQFTFGDPYSSTDSNTVTISMPYAAFNQTALYPFPGLNTTNRSMQYFPLRRANETVQFVMGRAFFQEAYVIANFENNTFSLSSATFVTGQSKEIEPIYPAATPTPTPMPKPVGPGTNVGAIVGGVVGGLGGLALILLIALLFLRRRKRKSSNQQPEEHPPAYPHAESPMGELEGRPFKSPNIGELESGRATPTDGHRHTSSQTSAESPPLEPAEMPAQETAAYELPSNAPLSRHRAFRRSQRSHPSVAGVLSGANASDETTDERRPSLRSRQLSDEASVSIASSESFHPISPASVTIVDNGRSRPEARDTSRPEEMKEFRERSISPEP